MGFLQGALYLAYSFGPASDMPIIELQSIDLLSQAGVIVVFLAVLGVVLAIRRGRGRVDLQASILFAGTLILAFANRRNGWLFIVAAALFISPLLVSPCADFSRFGKSRKADALARKAYAAMPVAVSAACALCVVTSVVLLSDGEQWEVDDSPSTPVVAIDTLNDRIAPERREDVSIFGSFDDGGYLEWFGYPVFMDPRPELWSSSVTGCEKDYAAEYARYLRGEVSAEEILNEYEIDYLITKDDTAMDAWCQEYDACIVLAEGDEYRGRGSNSRSVHEKPLPLSHGRPDHGMLIIGIHIAAKLLTLILIPLNPSGFYGMCKIEKEILMFKIIQGAMSRERLSQPTLSGQGSIEWIIIVAVIGIALIAPDGAVRHHEH